MNNNRLSGILNAGGQYLAQLQTPSGCIAEPQTASAPAFSERHLQAVWFDDQLRPTDLCTLDGVPVEVIHPGRWNHEAGPDFLDARVRILTTGEEVRGDLEIDMYVSGWTQHGHDTNPDFDSVNIHVTYSPSDPAAHPPGLNSSCIRIALQPSLSKQTDFSFDQIDLTAYPYSIPPPESPIRQRILHWPIDKKIALLRAAGEARLIKKAERQSSQTDPEALYEAFCHVLGYSKNSRSFRELAKRLPWAVLTSRADNEISAYALLAGMGGLLLEPTPSMHSDTKQWARTCWDQWWKVQNTLEATPLETDQWNLRQLRPLNHPRRRLATLSALAVQSPAFFTDLAEHNRKSPEQTLLSCKTQLEKLTSSFWSHRESPSQEARDNPIALMGQDRIHQFFNNVIVPLRLKQSDDPDTLRRWASGLASEPHNQITREALHTFFGPDAPRILSRTPLQKQGLIQLFEDWILCPDGNTSPDFRWLDLENKKGTE